MKKLEKELQETEAVESQQKRAKLVSVKREITFLNSTSNPSLIHVHGLSHQESLRWMNKQKNKQNEWRNHVSSVEGYLALQKTNWEHYWHSKIYLGYVKLKLFKNKFGKININIEIKLSYCVKWSCRSMISELTRYEIFMKYIWNVKWLVSSPVQAQILSLSHVSDKWPFRLY